MRGKTKAGIKSGSTTPDHQNIKLTRNFSDGAWGVGGMFHVVFSFRKIFIIVKLSHKVEKSRCVDWG
jgi:hypothetical protein